MSHSMAVKVKRFKQSDLLLDSIAIFGHLNQDLFFRFFPPGSFEALGGTFKLNSAFKKELLSLTGPKSQLLRLGPISLKNFLF